MKLQFLLAVLMCGLIAWGQSQHAVNPKLNPNQQDSAQAKNNTDTTYIANPIDINIRSIANDPNKQETRYYDSAELEENRSMRIIRYTDIFGRRHSHEFVFSHGKDSGGFGIGNHAVGISSEDKTEKNTLG